MSLLFSSHLLPDVEAVCDYVMVLGRGRLIAHGRIQELKQVQQRLYEVRVKSGQEQFVRQLEAAGCVAHPKEDFLIVEVPATHTETIFWKTASASGAQIRHLRPRRSTLEDVFLEAVGEQE